ncbi:amiloride-sensitive sodium channel subunit beta-like [Haliotis rubra]|uniref:amiloride-sensitive sodium channel subunit beta-like n=1 Tax=Haliotis rubra TaxID=36100 RepID=UPI001EE5D38D|nr:amiloride-sensitive sodium channel subunit beta-like [Haliotis rubra]
MAGDVCDQVSSGKCLRSILQRFADRTSMQGVSFLSTSRSWYARVIWSCLLLTSLAMLFYHLTYLIHIYYSWPKHTSMSIGFSPLPFPTITICNTNPVRLSQMKNVSKELKRFFEKTNPNRLAQELQRENRKQFGTVELRCRTCKLGSKGGEMGLNESSTSANIQIEFQNLFMKETRQRRIAIGHQLDDMMMDCSFACQTCSQRHFIRKTSSTFGNCYTLEHTKFVSKRSGPIHGLQLILNLENYEQLEGITTGNGFQLVVNPHGMLPFPVHDGITIDAGKETNIALKKVAIHRLGAPKWDCENGEMFRRKYNITYSVQTCQLLCEHEMISNTCKCYHVSEEEMIILMNTTKAYPACRTKKRYRMDTYYLFDRSLICSFVEVRCVLDQMALFETTPQNCSCGNPCRETKYEKRLSSRQWPSHSYAKVLKQKRCKVISAADCAKLDIPSTDLSLNFAKLNIFYEDLNYEVMKEEPDYELTQFVSDVGGTLGLWVGLSVLSIFELVQLLLELSTFATCRACRANGPDDDTQKLKEKKPPDFPPSYPSNPTGHISGFSGY